MTPKYLNNRPYYFYYSVTALPPRGRPRSCRRCPWPGPPAGPAACRVPFYPPAPLLGAPPPVSGVPGPPGVCLNPQAPANERRESVVICVY